ncbi:MAG: PTS sugar transporter subunit IIA [Enterobacteriaceae bacterium]
MLNQWLNKETITLASHVADWQAAVRLSAAPLIRQGVITPHYIDAIFEQHARLGPYYVLAPGIAMPHARPEQGALAHGLSLLVVKEGVSFADAENDPVYFIVMLAAKDSHSHIEMIACLSELLSCQDDIDAIIAAENLQAVMAIIDRY